jgi:hypothetical protein
MSGSADHIWRGGNQTPLEAMEMVNIPDHCWQRELTVGSPNIQPSNNQQVSLKNNL